MSRKILLQLLVFAFVTLGCGGGPDAEGPRPDGRAANEVADITGARASATEVIVTSDDASLPDGCDPRQIAALVIEFVDAFNRGDGERLSRLFFISEGPSPPDFSEAGYYPWSWYSVSEAGEGGRIEGGFVTYDKGELLRYFAWRHRQGERLNLIKISSTSSGILEE